MTKDLAEMPVVNYAGDAWSSGEFPNVLARMAVEHGPIFRRLIPDGPHTGQAFVFMVGPEANRFVLHTHRDHFSHHLGWTPIIGEDFGHGLLNMDDPEHASHRKMWNPAFTSACMEAYLPVINRAIGARTQTWMARREVDLYLEAREITFDAAAAALAGFRPGPAVDRLRELFYVIIHGFDPAHENWEHFITRAGNARSELAATLLELIAERRAAPLSESRDVLGMIVHARDEHGKVLSDAQVLAHLNILLIAGHETTTTLGTWVLRLLVSEPEHRRRIEYELRTLLGDTQELTVQALRGMRLLDNFIKEAGRLYAPVLNVPRGVVKPFDFGGYRVLAGTQVRLALAAGHRLPHIFTDPMRFDPDRFAPPREEDKRHQYALVTFGGGPRICIGISFAQIEVKALVAHVLRAFQLEPAHGTTPTHAGYWTAVLPEGMPVRVSAHPAAQALSHH